MIKTLVALAAAALVASATTYKVTDEADFYLTYQKTRPGDTIVLECDIVMGLNLDKSGMATSIISIVSDGTHKIGPNNEATVKITASHIRLSGLQINCPVFISGVNVAVDNVDLRAQLTINGTSNTFSNSKFFATGIKTPMEINGNYHTIKNVTMTDDYSGNFGETEPFVAVRTTGLSFVQNVFTEYQNNYGRRKVFVNQYSGNQNSYVRNKCMWKLYVGVNKTMFYLTIDGHSDHVCATNTANTGVRTNSIVDSNC